VCERTGLRRLELVGDVLEDALKLDPELDLLQRFAASRHRLDSAMAVARVRTSNDVVAVAVRYRSCFVTFWMLRIHTFTMAWSELRKWVSVACSPKSSTRSVRPPSYTVYSVSKGSRSQNKQNLE